MLQNNSVRSRRGNYPRASRFTRIAPTALSKKARYYVHYWDEFSLPRGNCVRVSSHSRESARAGEELLMYLNRAQRGHRDDKAADRWRRKQPVRMIKQRICGRDNSQPPRSGSARARISRFAKIEKQIPVALAYRGERAPVPLPLRSSPRASEEEKENTSRDNVPFVIIPSRHFPPGETVCILKRSYQRRYNPARAAPTLKASESERALRDGARTRNRGRKGMEE